MWPVMHHDERERTGSGFQGLLNHGARTNYGRMMSLNKKCALGQCEESVKVRVETKCRVLCADTNKRCGSHEIGHR